MTYKLSNKMMSEGRDGASEGGEQKDPVPESDQGRLWETLNFGNEREPNT